MTILTKINILTEEQYQELKANNEIDPNQLYMTTSDPFYSLPAFHTNETILISCTASHNFTGCELYVSSANAWYDASQYSTYNKSEWSESTGGTIKITLNSAVQSAGVTAYRVSYSDGTKEAGQLLS